MKFRVSDEFTHRHFQHSTPCVFSCHVGSFIFIGYRFNNVFVVVAIFTSLLIIAGRSVRIDEFIEDLCCLAALFVISFYSAISIIHVLDGSSSCMGLFHAECAQGVRRVAVAVTRRGGPLHSEWRRALPLPSIYCQYIYRGYWHWLWFRKRRWHHKSQTVALWWVLIDWISALRRISTNRLY